MVRLEVATTAERPIFVISDLHIGDNGRSDHLALHGRQKLLNNFLDYVDQQDGELIILGDLFEFCRCNLGKVLVSRKALLDRLTQMDATYVVGNHDVELAPLIGADMLRHPFFNNMTHPFTRQIADRKFMFMHGHELDPLNRGDNPGWAKVLGILRGIIEERNGRPLRFSNRFTDACVGIKDKTLHRFDNLKVKMGRNAHPKRPGMKRKMVRRYHHDLVENGYDVAIVGHTHRAGKCSNWYYNSGSWTGRHNDFLRISPNGTVEVFRWSAEGPVLNNKTIRY
ncbi:MAG TPA: UDP-2,3-diacylglucosamine diphosphatase [Sedimentisphaerales bacterium]|nr:UDP-2,3-diacylglucosamine diphosphatase [Sedimentisphaerales bacterium]